MLILTLLIVIISALSGFLWIITWIFVDIYLIRLTHQCDILQLILHIHSICFVPSILFMQTFMAFPDNVHRSHKQQNMWHSHHSISTCKHTIFILSSQTYRPLSKKIYFQIRCCILFATHLAVFIPPPPPPPPRTPAYSKCPKISKTLKFGTPNIFAQNNFWKCPKISNSSIFFQNGDF